LKFQSLPSWEFGLKLWNEILSYKNLLFGSNMFYSIWPPQASTLFCHIFIKDKKMLGWWCPPFIKYNIKYDFLLQHVDFSCILIQTGEKIENMCKSLPETMTSLRQSTLPVSRDACSGWQRSVTSPVQTDDVRDLVSK
jgi:hypothetical protein